jgi:hypothetical protein
MLLPITLYGYKDSACNFSHDRILAKGSFAHALQARTLRSNTSLHHAFRKHNNSASVREGRGVRNNRGCLAFARRGIPLHIPFPSKLARSNRL